MFEILQVPLAKNLFFVPVPGKLLVTLSSLEHFKIINVFLADCPLVGVETLELTFFTDHNKFTVFWYLPQVRN